MPPTSSFASDAPVFRCPVCGRDRPAESGREAESVHGDVRGLMLGTAPAWDGRAAVCEECLHRHRAGYIERCLAEERGELSSLESEVMKSLREQELIASNLNEAFEGTATVGERVADRVASFGGSWRFIILFAAVVAAWIAYNGGKEGAFDPFPFILLNLALSCVAALQAPVIMMSQNRQEAKDRLRADHDYRINLKAELEVRHLNLKMDQLLTHQWRRLLEIQKIQVDLMEELSRRK
jgi:uncharacterized membrane protein